MVLRRLQPRRTAPTTCTVIRQLTAPGSPAIGSVIPPRHDARPVRRQADLEPEPEPHARRPRPSATPATITGPVFNIAGPEVTWNGTRDIGSTDFVGPLRRHASATRFLIRAMYGLHKEKDDVRRRRPEHGAAHRPDRRPEHACRTASAFFQDQEFSRDVLKLDMTKFLGTPRDQDRRRLRARRTRLSENYQGGAGQRIYQLRQASTGIDLLPPPLLRRRPGAGLRPRRPGHLADRAARRSPSRAPRATRPTCRTAGR